jgi:hypothetical protein
MLAFFLGVISGFLMSRFIDMFVGPFVFSIGYKLFSWWLEDLPFEVYDYLILNQIIDIYY